jgi:hypothetical protein
MNFVAVERTPPLYKPIVMLTAAVKRGLKVSASWTSQISSGDSRSTVTSCLNRKLSSTFTLALAGIVGRVTTSGLEKPVSLSFIRALRSSLSVLLWMMKTRVFSFLESSNSIAAKGRSRSTRKPGGALFDVHHVHRLDPPALTVVVFGAVGGADGDVRNHDVPRADTSQKIRAHRPRKYGTGCWTASWKDAKKASAIDTDLSRWSWGCGGCGCGCGCGGIWCGCSCGCCISLGSGGK